MKEFKKDGPKRRRATRRETSPVSRQGYLDGVDNFKREREAKRDAPVLRALAYAPDRVPQARGRKDSREGQRG